LLGWADMIYVFDTGSVDGTWEIVEGAALREPRIRPIRRDSVYFSQKLVRGWLFRQARQQMRDGDWFLRVDADEFYHIPPPEFVKTYMRKHETIAYHQYYNFCLLESEVAAWEGGRETLADRARPIHDRRRWYIPASYSEPRMCRYRRTMRWPSTVSFPYNAGFIARERLPIRHYPHRDPAQLVRRCHLRAAMMADGTRPEWHHWNNTDWRTFVTSDSSPGLKYWNPGQDLPRVDFSSHLSKGHIRLMQRLTHAFLLPALDRLRPDWNDDVYPERIPEVEFRRLEETMLQIDRQLRDGHMEDATFTSSLENVTRK
jgi:glycosyltransferase involved in cell wall biosynthesis